VTSAAPESSVLPQKLNVRYVVTISLVAALGGLLFGYDWVVIGGAKPFFERFFHLADATAKGWANSCALIGCLFGALLAGALSDRFGRKRPLIFAASLFAITSIGNGLAGSFAAFVAWRMLGGVAIGLASNLSPMYIAEIAPARMRGRLVSINQLTIVVGILLAQIVNWALVLGLPKDASEAFLLSSWYGQQGWRWMFALTAVPAALFFVGMLFVPESPRWLAQAGRWDEARRLLGRIGGNAYASRCLTEIEATLRSETARLGLRPLLAPKLRNVLLLGIGLAVFQQWCGINVIFNYAEEIFAAAGYRVSDIMLNIVVTGVVNLVFTVVAIATVDRLGRRALMMVGAGGLAAIYALLGVLFFTRSQGVHVLTLVVSAIGCYAMSLAPVTWVIISEIFPNRVRGAAMSVAVTSLWIACFLLTFTFPTLNRALGPAGTFWVYGAICLAGLLFIRSRLPETKGRSLEEIERGLVDTEET
jgi:sugar porter (SP) family MFS transporter